MRVLVLAVDGMLGHVVCDVLSRAHDVHGTCRGAPAASPMRGLGERLHGGVAVGERQRLRQVLVAVRPQVAVNCLGLVPQRTGGDDAAALRAANAEFPHVLAELADEVGTKVVHVSTDCVFSGERGGYGVGDVPDPVDAYGRSKLDGEIVRAPHMTLRTSLVGRQLRGSHGLLEWLLARPPGRVPGYSRVVFSGLATVDFAGALERLLARAPGLVGLYHVAASPISKHELLLRVCRALALPLEVVADDARCCDRSLDGSAFAAAAGWRAPSWEAMVQHLAADAPRYQRLRTTA